jgi:hypothetical protein
MLYCPSVISRNDASAWAEQRDVPSVTAHDDAIPRRAGASVTVL